MVLSPQNSNCVRLDLVISQNAYTVPDKYV